MRSCSASKNGTQKICKGKVSIRYRPKLLQNTAQPLSLIVTLSAQSNFSNALGTKKNSVPKGVKNRFERIGGYKS